ncbi:hypothetical protein MMC28_007092 [Mycoblastus sanguinarius]|nr:hypothetical protein [Mycoblastus sanguinarius]
MHFTYLLPLAALPFSLAKTIDINVGNGALVFSPNNVPAAIGDVLAFHYFPQNHSVAQSSFAAPCVPLAGAATPAIFSGFVPEPASGPTTFAVTVNATTPLWFYCAQGKHCESGMSMVVNQPNTNSTLTAYQAAAAKLNTTVIPPKVGGGVFLKNGTTNTTSSTTSSASGVSSSGTSKTGPGSGVLTFTGGAEKVGMVGVWGVIALGLGGLILV